VPGIRRAGDEVASGRECCVLSSVGDVQRAGKDIAPIKVPLIRLAPGHDASYAFQLPFAGTWQMSVRALITDTEENTFTVKVPIH
jgi:hypothetical protein